MNSPVKRGDADCETRPQLTASIQEALNGTPATWLVKVSDEQYRK
jgi:hypothetical protein